MIIACVNDPSTRQPGCTPSLLMLPTYEERGGVIESRIISIDERGGTSPIISVYEWGRGGYWLLLSPPILGNQYVSLNLWRARISNIQNTGFLFATVATPYHLQSHIHHIWWDVEFIYGIVKLMAAITSRYRWLDEERREVTKSWWSFSFL